MNTAINRLETLLVKDIMNTNVLTIAESDEMHKAAQNIFDAEVTGAPVVDALGKCVGVLSATDFVGRDAGRHELQFLSRTNPNQPYQLECMNDNLVCSHMSPLVQTVAEDSTLIDAARIMCIEGIHRLVVVDQQDRPVGILSTLDITAALVHSIDE
jgi:CBS domain-containing protein